MRKETWVLPGFPHIMQPWKGRGDGVIEEYSMLRGSGVPRCGGK